MVTTHATKNRVRYRYYVSAPCMRGPTDQPVGSVKRVPAQDIEQAVVKAIVADSGTQAAISDGSDLNREALASIVAKIEVRPGQLAIYLKAVGDSGHGDQDLDGDDMLAQPLTKARTRHSMEESIDR